MKISEYKASLPILFANKITPLVWGYHGIGKSTAPQQFADEGGHRLYNVRLGNLEAGDLIGLPTEDVQNGIKTATRNLMPVWLKDLIDFCVSNPDKYGILHLDEINHARKDMQSYIFQISLDKRLNDIVFPPNLHVIASANPPTDDYSGVFDFTNKALLSRFCHIKLAPSADEWLAWARDAGISDSIVEYISNHPDKLDPALQPFSVDEYASPSRRNFELASRIFNAGGSRELLMGVLGSVEVGAFYTWLENNRDKPITAAEVLTDYSKVRDRIRSLADRGKLAALQSVSAAITKDFVARPEGDLIGKKALLDNLVAYMDDLPMELRFVLLCDILMLPALCVAPDSPGHPNSEPGTVLGPHSYPHLMDFVKKVGELGIYKKIQEEAEQQKAAVGGAPAPKKGKKK